ncbi:hypothetical protein [Enterobacter soli]|uniref:hypothetical protein n=1 Tax=Enterobacter soli TaxID=885040 RepID=UPI003EDB545A
MANNQKKLTRVLASALLLFPFLVFPAPFIAPHVRPVDPVRPIDPINHDGRVFHPIPHQAPEFHLTPQDIEAHQVFRVRTIDELKESDIKSSPVLPPMTRVLGANSGIYVEYTPNGKIYYRSNYISAGFSNPTRIYGNPNKIPILKDIESVVLNIFYADNSLSQSAADYIWRNFKEQATLTLDISMFDENGVPRIDLTGIKNIKIVDTNRNEPIYYEYGEILQTRSPPPSLIAKIKGCCFYGRPPSSIEGYREMLSAKPFHKNDIKIASMFIDSATEHTLKKDKILKSKQLKFDPRKIASIDDFKKMLSKAHGKTLILLGHVEDSHYVIRDSKNIEIFKISIKEARELAVQESITLIDIGCETAKAIDSNSLGIGVATTYNSVNSLKSIKDALINSRNFEDFMSNISSEGLKIVIDKSFVDNHVRTLHASIYSKIKNSIKDLWLRNLIKDTWITVSQVSLSTIEEKK